MGVIFGHHISNSCESGDWGAYRRGQLGTPRPQRLEARFPAGSQPGLGACASLSLLRPPSPYFSSLSPPPVAAAAARPRHFRPTGLPSPAHSFAARAGEQRGHPQVGAPSPSRRVRAAPAVCGGVTQELSESVQTGGGERWRWGSGNEICQPMPLLGWHLLGWAECERWLPTPRTWLVIVVFRFSDWCARFERHLDCAAAGWKLKRSATPADRRTVAYT